MIGWSTQQVLVLEWVVNYTCPCLAVFSTQQMLAAIGLGASRRLPAAAAVNWVLKDGLGRLGKLTVATNFGRAFDSDVKRFRFTSSVVFDAASFIEMITPFYPQKFLLLATIANVGKSVGITTANVVRAPIQRSFALEENLAEVTAKTSAQQVLADNIGLALAVAATRWTGNLANTRLRMTLPLMLFVPLAAVDLFCIYKELKAVQLRTINKERGEIIAEGFIQRGHIPSFKAVADAERLFIPARMDESSLPLKITRLGEACPTPEALAAALCDAPTRPYVLSYLPYSGTKQKNPLQRLLTRPRQPMSATAVATKEKEPSGHVGACDVMGTGTATRTQIETRAVRGTGGAAGTTEGAYPREGTAEVEAAGAGAGAAVTAGAGATKVAPPKRSPGGSGTLKGPGLKGSAFIALGQHATSRDTMQAVLQVTLDPGPYTPEPHTLILNPGP